MRPFILGFIASFVVLPTGALAYFRLGLAEVRSDTRPPAWETQLMHSAVRASVRRSASGIQVPPPGNVEDAMVQGGKLYLNGCAGCHGEPGKAEEDLSHYPPVPQLAQIGTQYSEPEMYWIIKHGIRNTAMSAYGPFYSDKEMWALAGFLGRIDDLPPGVLERIQQKKAPGASTD
jgi:mono/diheme cytochrome c family protein